MCSSLYRIQPLRNIYCSVPLLLLLLPQRPLPLPAATTKIRWFFPKSTSLILLLSSSLRNVYFMYIIHSNVCARLCLLLLLFNTIFVPFSTLFKSFVCVWQIFFARRSHQKRVNLCIQFSTMNEQDSSWKQNWFNFDEWISNKITHSSSSDGGGGDNRNARIFQMAFYFFVSAMLPLFCFL